MIVGNVIQLKTRINNKMIGGWIGRIEDYPHVASFIMIDHESDSKSVNYKLFCGGTIINKFWILTAGHCVNGFIYNYEKKIRIIFGQEVFYTDRIENNQTREIAEIILHDNYTRKIYFNTVFNFNDIALVRIKEEINFSSVAKPMDLIEEGEMIESRYSIITGVERFDDRSILVANNVLILDKDKCRSMSQKMTEKHICGTWKINDTACFGDSGSGLFSLRESGKRFLIGVVSYGNPVDRNTEKNKCSRKQIYIYYSAVSYYSKWIKKTIKSSQMMKLKIFN